MYWTDWVQRPTGVSAKIERAAMSGGEVHRQVVVDGDVLPLVWPNGLSLDTTNQLLYFCDAYTDRIEVIDLKNPQYPRSVSVFSCCFCLNTVQLFKDNLR
jgi:low density lipoprotein receptor-related protein 5/6